MKKFSLKEILTPVLSLLLIAVLCAGLVAAVNQKTNPLIEAQEKAAGAAAMREIFPDAAAFDPVEFVTLDGKEYAYSAALDSKGMPAGYVFTTAAKGYGGDVEVMTGIDLQGKITNILPLTLTETPGLGMKAQEETFLSQFSGIRGAVRYNKNESLKEGEILVISGATITTKAFTDAVNLAFSLYSILQEEGTQ